MKVNQNYWTRADGFSLLAGVLTLAAFTSYQIHKHPGYFASRPKCNPPAQSTDTGQPKSKPAFQQ